MNAFILSFDDSLVAQLKWGRTLQALGLRGVFYISPGRLGSGARKHRRGHWEIYLTEDHVAKLADMGHLIGNHTWWHEAPGVGVTEEDILVSISRAEEWLGARGWSGKLLALPYGVRGGEWGEPLVQKLLSLGYALRDVRFEGERAAPSGLPAALESTALPLVGECDSRYFHGNHNTSDEAFAAFVYAIAAEVTAGRARCALPGEE